MNFSNVFVVEQNLGPLHLLYGEQCHPAWNSCCCLLRLTFILLQVFVRGWFYYSLKSDNLLYLSSNNSNFSSFTPFNTFLSIILFSKHNKLQAQAVFFVHIQLQPLIYLDLFHLMKVPWKHKVGPWNHGPILCNQNSRNMKIYNVETLALGLWPKQGLVRVRAKREAQESHLMLLRV
jgi:hypothetical protein